MQAVKQADCRFYMCDWYIAGSRIYTCELKLSEILKPETVIKGFNGEHEEGRTNLDVQGIYCQGGSVHYVPIGLNELFPNLTHVAIIHCGLKKICRQNFIELEKLSYLNVSGNHIEVLPDDLFAGVKSLKSISFYENRIKSVSSRVLDPIKNQLEFADFRKNSESINFYFRRSSIMSTSIDDLMKHFDNKECLKECHPDEASVEESKHLAFSKIFHKKFERLWTTGDFSDLTVFAGNKQFKVHKTVLAVQSPVFARMFEQQPKFEEGEPRIEFSAEATEEALEHLYTGKQLSAAKVKEVLELAVKYEMQELKEACVQIIESHIDESNALDVLELANRCGIPSIKSRAFEVVKSMFPKKRMSDSMIDNIERLKEMAEAKRKYNLLCEDLD